MLNTMTICIIFYKYNGHCIAIPIQPKICSPIVEIYAQICFTVCTTSTICSLYVFVQTFLHMCIYKLFKGNCVVKICKGCSFKCNEKNLNVFLPVYTA